jgi:hypothetical protein
MEKENGIKKAVENAMEDLAGLSEPADDAHAPDPGNPDDDVQVHSSISEGSNAMDTEEANRSGPPASDRGESPEDPSSGEGRG